MRIVLADLKGGEGFTSKDTVAGGYGSRLRPFSKVTSVVARVKREFHDLPSVHLAYVAAIAARAGHEVVATAGELKDADVAIVLSSLVDFKRENAWADAMRARGVRVLSFMLGSLVACKVKGHERLGPRARLLRLSSSAAPKRSSRASQTSR